MKGVVGSGTYKNMIQMVDEHKGLYKEVHCVDSPYPRKYMGLVYSAVYLLLITEVGPLFVHSLLC